jgi:sugar phosphate isomerase/epimerase
LRRQAIVGDDGPGSGKGETMFINLCPGTVGLDSADFRKLVPMAAMAGFGGIDVPAGSFSDGAEALEFGQWVKRFGLRTGLFLLPCDFLAVDDDGFEEGLDRLTEVAPLAAAAGCRRTYNHVWPGSNERDFQENWDWHVGRLRILLGVLTGYGIRLGIEFIGPKTLRDTFAHEFIHTLPQALELAGAVGPELGIVLDTFHWYTSGGSLEDIAHGLSARRIVNVHVNDATAGRSREEQQDLERQMPLATGRIDAVAVLRSLDDLGYDGPVMCEPFQPSVGRFRQMEPADVLAAVAASMKKLFAAAGVAT